MLKPVKVTGAANLRKNERVEQLTATRCRQQHDWRAGRIDRLVSAYHADV